VRAGRRVECVCGTLGTSFDVSTSAGIAENMPTWRCVPMSALASALHAAQIVREPSIPSTFYALNLIVRIHSPSISYIRYQTYLANWE
jgi:hypothetical protein